MNWSVISYRAAQETRARCKNKPPDGKEFSWNDDMSEMTKKQIASVEE